MNNKVESAFYKTIMEGVAKYVKKNTPTYATAKVVSIDDDGTPYVQFPGAETTTPVTTVTNAAKGDEVLVQVNSNGDAYVYGNLTDQPVSKVEVEKITENTTNVLEQFDYSLQEIIDKLNLEDYVKIGESNVPILSNILKLENNILDIQNGDEGLVHLRVTTEGLELGNYSEQYGLNNYIFFSKDGFGRIGPLQTGVNYGQFSLSVGLGRATSQFALAAGPSATASQVGAFAHGTSTASGYLSFAANVSTATGPESSSFGNSTASGDFSFSEGSGTHAYGRATHVEGINSNAYGSATHVEGDSNTVYGSSGHGEGRGNTVNEGGDSEHIEGCHNSLTPYGSGKNHIEGTDNTATGAEFLHIEGYGHSITGSSAVHVEGWVNTNLQNLSYSHIEGQTNRASGSSVIHVEGLTNSITNSSQTHVEGLNNTVSSSNNSHIEGLRNTVSNSSETHVEGLNNNVIASGSFVGGSGNVVSGTEEYEYRFGGDGSTNSFDIGTDWSEILYVKIDNVEIERYGYPISYNISEGRYIVFYNSVDPDDSAPADESLIKVNVLKTGIKRDNIFIHALNGVAQYSHQSILGYYNDNKSDTLLEIGNGTSGTIRGNAFEVTNDGYIRTGVGVEKIAFGKNQSNVYGYYKGDGTFVPWITQDTTYTAGTNIDITNNVISAPNVAPIINGKVPEQYLPSYVDDVIEGYYYNGSFYEDDQHQELITPERGKIYISLDTDKSYRWSGTVYVELTSGGVVYTAGDGIDISPTNEISVNNDIARTADIPTIPTNVSAFTNDVGYLTQHQDLSNYIQKSLTAGLIKNDGTIDTTDYAEASDIPDVSNFISKSQTSGLVKNDGTIDTTAYATASALAGFLPLAGGTMTGAINSQHIVPATNDSYRLGSSSSKYNSAYIKRIYSLASIESTTDGSKRLLVPAKSGTIAVNEDLPEVVGNLIAVNPILESGTLIANITINGDSKNIYAPPGGSTYTAGNGIDISNNEISVDNTIARLTDIPSVGNGTLTIQKNGTNVQTFTANQSGNATANIVVPFDYNETSVDDDQEFKGAPHYGKFSGNSSVGELMDGDDGVYMFLPYGTNSLSYGFVLACNDDGNQFYLGSLNGEDSDGTIDWSRIYHDGYHPSAAKLDVPRDSVSPNTAVTTAPAKTVRIDECNPNAAGAPEANWFHYITTHSIDTRYGSQLALGMTTNKVYSRDYNGGTWGAWKRLAFADEIPSVSGFLPLAGGTMTGASGIQFPTTIGANKSGHWISAGGGYSTGSGKSGVKIIVCDQSDGISGLGQDCGGGPYELSVIMAAQPGTGTGYIRFLKHVTDSTTYTKLAEIDGSGNFIPQGSIRGNNYANGYGVDIGCGLDIYPQSSSAGYGGYIDFHYDQSSADYTSRILESSSRHISIQASDGTDIGGNTVINPQGVENWQCGLRINSEPNRADGYAVVTFGAPNGTLNGTNDSYPMYQIGKTRSMGGAFFLNSRISGVERVLMYGHNAGLQFYSFDQTKQVDIQNDGIRTRTNKLYLHGKDNNYSDGSGEPSSPLILDGFESGQITANSSENTNVDIAPTGDELVLVFLSAASGNSFYAVRLLRNNNGTLQTINLASNGTSIADISLNANQTNYITIKNKSSSYRLYYKILKLS